MATVAERRRSLEPPATESARTVEEPDQEERPFWQVVALLYGAIFFLAVLLTAVCFLSAWLATGKPY